MIVYVVNFNLVNKPESTYHDYDFCHTLIAKLGIVCQWVSGFSTLNVICTSSTNWNMFVRKLRILRPGSPLLPQIPRKTAGTWLLPQLQPAPLHSQGSEDEVRMRGRSARPQRPKGQANHYHSPFKNRSNLWPWTWI